MQRKNKKPKSAPIVPESASADRTKSGRIKQFIRINWLDIVAEEDAPRSFLDSHTPTELLAKKLNSTGYIYKEDEYALVLCRDEDEANISYLVLPKCVITEMKELYRADVCTEPHAPISRGHDRKKPKSARRPARTTTASRRKRK